MEAKELVHVTNMFQTIPVLYSPHILFILFTVFSQ